MKVLVAAARPPWPPRRGDQLRARQLVAALATQHEVTLLAPPAIDEPAWPASVRRETFAPRGAARAVIAALPGLLRGWPLQALPFRQPALGRRLRRLAPEHDRVLLLLARLLPHVADAGATPLVVDLIDCLSLNVATRAQVDRAALRPALAFEAHRLRAAEQAVLRRARRGFVVCERDRNALAAGGDAGGERLDVVPIAVPATTIAAPPLASSRTVVLTGNLGYFPNRDAARWFLRAVWPELRRARGDARLVLAGDRPPRSIAHLATRAGARLVERPADMQALLRESAVAVAPLRCGSGVPLKVLDAWRAGVPVVASPFAAAGADGEDERDLLVATAPEQWVTQIARALDDGALRGRLVEGGAARLALLAPERVYPRIRRLVTGD